MNKKELSKHLIQISSNILELLPPEIFDEDYKKILESENYGQLLGCTFDNPSEVFIVEDCFSEELKNKIKLNPNQIMDNFIIFLNNHYNLFFLKDINITFNSVKNNENLKKHQLYKKT